MSALEHLDDNRCTSDVIDSRQDILSVTDKGGRRYPQIVAAQNLEGTQLVAGVGDSERRVETDDVHLFELAHDRGSEVGDRRADPRDHGVKVCQWLPTIKELGIALLQIDRKSRRVENPHAMTPCLRGLLQTPRTIGARFAREDSNPHDSSGLCRRR